MSEKKAARQRGKHVTYFQSDLPDARGKFEIFDYSPAAQAGLPKTMSYRLWEEKYQEMFYLVPDKAWKAPPVVVISDDARAKARKFLEDSRPKKKAAEKPSDKREEALRGVVRRVARWEGSKSKEDLLGAHQYASFVEELWPDLKEQIKKEFERAT